MPIFKTLIELTVRVFCFSTFVENYATLENIMGEYPDGYRDDADFITLIELTVRVFCFSTFVENYATLENIMGEYPDSYRDDADF
jgi:hypothetical protein